MFEKLKKKWNVNNLQLTLILFTFAIGGTLTGKVAKHFLTYIDLPHIILTTIVYILLLTLVWPVMVLIVSIPFGQFNFFKNYLLKVAKRMRIIKGD
ncbi:MAG: hypothetical protein UZ11_BCD004001301 [Bacteroidetes bacterium OLB11]|nr:MAG: hypothetical protein UZ11_BCD004001301 [Bacteroidetes bacterium OLB11]